MVYTLTAHTLTHRQLATSHQPVSYTHLDVYKRQFISSPNFWAVSHVMLHVVLYILRRGHHRTVALSARAWRFHEWSDQIEDLICRTGLSLGATRKYVPHRSICLPKSLLSTPIPNIHLSCLSGLMRLRRSATHIVVEKTPTQILRSRK